MNLLNYAKYTGQKVPLRIDISVSVSNLCWYSIFFINVYHLYLQCSCFVFQFNCSHTCPEAYHVKLPDFGENKETVCVTSSQARILTGFVLCKLQLILHYIHNPPSGKTLTHKRISSENNHRLLWKQPKPSQTPISTKCSNVRIETVVQQLFQH